MKVIMEIVVGQTAWDSVLMAAPGILPARARMEMIIPPDPAWTDVAGLNYAIPEVRHYMIEMMEYWLQELWRGRFPL